MVNNIVVFNTGRLRLMHMVMEGDFSVLDGNCTIHLFVNDMTLPATRVLDDFVEMTMSGYLPQVLSGAIDEGIDSNESDTWVWPSLAFTCSITPIIPVIAFGYYVTHNDDGELLWGQLFDVPPVWSIAGDSYTLAAQLSLGACCNVNPPPKFRLFEFDACLRAEETSQFQVDAVIWEIMYQQFDIDGYVRGGAAVEFEVDGAIAEIETDDFDIDGLVVDKQQKAFAIDGVIQSIDTNTLHINGLIANLRERHFAFFSTIADRHSSTFSVDALKALRITKTFSVAGAIRGSPGTIIRTPGTSTITSLAGFNKANVFLIGCGGNGGASFTNQGGTGGGGAGFSGVFGTPVTPGANYSYTVAAGGSNASSSITLQAVILTVTQGQNGITAFPGGGGIASGGTVNFAGGAGGARLLGVVPAPGAGGGQAANINGAGAAGAMAAAGVTGVGGGPKLTRGSGGDGSTPAVSPTGRPGINPGGAGGGGGTINHSVEGVGGAGQGGLLVAAWSASVTWIDAYLATRPQPGFSITAAIAGQPTASFSVNGTIAARTTATFSISAAIATVNSQSFSADAAIAGQNSKLLTVDATVAARITKTFTVDGSLKGSTLKSFSFDAAKAARFSATHTITGLVASQTAKTHTVDASLQSLRILDTFFTAVNGTALSAHTMDVGPGWTITVISGSAGDQQVFTNPLQYTRNVNPTSGRVFCVTNASATNNKVTATFRFSSATLGYIAIFNRWVDINNAWRATVNRSANNFVLTKFNAGTPTTVGTIALPATSAGVDYVVYLECLATAITARVEDIFGNSLALITTSDALHAAATKCAFEAIVDNGTSFPFVDLRRFSVTG